MGNYQSLEKLFKPQAVAVVGASKDKEKLSGQPLINLLKTGYKGKIYPVNPKVDSIEGLKSYKSIKKINNPVDVAIINLPAPLATQAVEECAELGIPFAIVAVSGFSEMNTSEGIALQNKLAEIGKKTGIRIVGPNTNGIYNIHDHVSIGYNVTHSMMLKKGNVSLISHSGALFSSIESLSRKYPELGFSNFVAAGNEVDLDLIDYLEYMIEEKHTKIVTMILDGISDVNKFRELSKRAAQKGKYLVALKIGNSDTGLKATMAHSARLSGSYRNYKALLKECGVIQVDTIEALVAACAILNSYNLTNQNELVGLSTSGAGCAMIADMADQYGLSVPQLSTRALDLINQKKGFGTPMNPYDIGAAGVTTAMEFIAKAMGKEESAGFMIYYSTILQTETIRSQSALQFSKVCNELDRMPFIVIAPGPLSSEELEIYRDNQIIVFESTNLPFEVIRAITTALQYREREETVNLQEVEIDHLAKLDEEKIPYKILETFHVPVPEQEVVTDVEKLLPVCQRMGYPLVIKGISRENTHKSDAGLVWMNVNTNEDVEKVQRSIQNLEKNGIVLDGILIQELIKGETEVLVGINHDPDVGYMLIIGSGGKYTEIYNDIETITIPASRESIRKAFLNTNAGKIVNGARNNGLTAEEVIDIAFRIQGVTKLKGITIESMDINPLIVGRDRTTAVDVRILFNSGAKDLIEVISEI